MENKASVTALMSCFARAYHAENNREHVFSDAAAKAMLSGAEYAAVRDYILGGMDFLAPGMKFADESEALTYAVDTQLAPTPLARSRYCEDCLAAAVRTGTTQYVILGAGLDTFAWRKTALMKRLTVFEADHPLTQADKRGRLERAGLTVPDNLRFVPLDFTKDDLKSALLAQGFDETRKTFFSWLGVSYYLSSTEIEALLGSISSFAAEGSTLVFDCADAGLFSADEARVRRMLAMAQAGGEPMKFCAGETEMTALLERHNFLIYEYLSPDAINDLYFSGRRDGMTAFEHICCVTAVLKGAPFINTKEKILQSALKLFSRNGYEAVSMKDIADSLSLTKAAIYKHYASKRDIFDQIVLRMESDDARRAAQYGVPAGAPEREPEAYRAAQLGRLADFTRAQFGYWTENPFACRFRRMLTLEQYRGAEMSALYQQYLCGGPLGYTADIFEALLGDAEAARQAALDFYAPVFLLYSLYDGGRGAAKPAALLDAHIRRFTESFEGRRGADGR